MSKDDELLICFKRPSEIPEVFMNYKYNVFSSNAEEDYLKYKSISFEDKALMHAYIYEWLQFNTNPIFNPNITIVRRGDAEFNQNYIQLVGALVIICGPKIILLKCKKGDMLGKLTLVQGHCNYNPLLYKNTPLYPLILFETMREFDEEIKASRYLRYQMEPEISTFFSFNFSDPSDISYYHFGIIQTISILPELELVITNTEHLDSNEKDKNDLFIADVREDIYQYEPDSWLASIFNYFKWRYENM